MHAADHHVQPGKKIGILVERAVLVDVDLDAGQQAEGAELGVQRRDLVQLRPQAFRREAVRHRQTRGVIGDRDVCVPELDGRLGHLPDAGAAVRRLGVDVTVAA